MIIAIDGPAGAGKGTLAAMLANYFSLAHLDTGSLYRAVAAKVLKDGADPADARAAARAAKHLALADTRAANLRDEEVSAASSVVAAIPAVRAALLEFQRNFARNPPTISQGSVLDGRDIGTVVCPEPDVIKLYVHASLEERARRRHRELQDRKDSTTYARVLQDMKARDQRDTGRSVAALKKADDAYDLDTTGLSIDQAFEKALAFVMSKRTRRQE